ASGEAEVRRRLAVAARPLGERLVEHQELVCVEVPADGLAAPRPDDAQLVDPLGAAETEVRLRRILRHEVAAGPELPHLRPPAGRHVDARADRLRVAGAAP